MSPGFEAAVSGCKSDFGDRRSEADCPVAPHWHTPELVKSGGVIRFITSKWISGVSISGAADTEDP